VALLFVYFVRDQSHLGPGTHRTALVSVRHRALVDDCRNAFAVEPDGFPIRFCELTLELLLREARDLRKLGVVGEYAAGQRVVKREVKRRRELLGFQGARFRQAREFVEAVFPALDSDRAENDSTYLALRGSLARIRRAPAGYPRDCRHCRSRTRLPTASPVLVRWREALPRHPGTAEPHAEVREGGFP